MPNPELLSHNWSKELERLLTRDFQNTFQSESGAGTVPSSSEADRLTSDHLSESFEALVTHILAEVASKYRVSRDIMFSKEFAMIVPPVWSKSFRATLLQVSCSISGFALATAMLMNLR